MKRIVRSSLILFVLAAFLTPSTFRAFLRGGRALPMAQGAEEEHDGETENSDANDGDAVEGHSRLGPSHRHTVSYPARQGFATSVPVPRCASVFSPAHHRHALPPPPRTDRLLI